MQTEGHSGNCWVMPLGGRRSVFSVAPAILIICCGKGEPKWVLSWKFRQMIWT